MLERTPWPWPADRPPRDHRAAGQRFVTYADIAFFCRQYLLTIVGFVLLGIVLAGLYAFSAEPIYTAKTQILIDRQSPQLPKEQVGDINLSLDTAQVESQMAVLRSEKIATMVIDRLDLMQDPEFRNLPGSTVGRMLTLIMPNLVAQLRRDDREELTEFERSRRAMEVFARGFDVRRLGVSYAIEIAFSSGDPEKAAQIANATAEAYVREQMETKFASARESNEWMERRISELRDQMNVATQNVQEFRARHDYRVMDRENAQAAEQGGEDHGGPTLVELEATADTYRRMYESFLQAYTTFMHRQSYPIADARVITPATRPLGQSYPRKKLILTLGALLGIMGGVGVAFLRHTLDRSVHSVRQIREEVGLECLGELPVLAAVRGEYGPYAAVVRAPISPFSENLRSVKTAIGFANSASPTRCLGITSALPHEGKSTLASNLATLFSMSGSRTLVIDADLHTSTLSNKFAPRAASGIVEALRDRERAREHVVKAAGGFDLLPAPSADVLNSSDMLGSQRMQALLQTLLESYETIIVDLPPLKSAADALAFSPLLDGVVLVTEWGRTPVDLVAEASHSLRAAKASVMGVVMTKVRFMSKQAYRKRAIRTSYRESSAPGVAAGAPQYRKEKAGLSQAGR